MDIYSIPLLILTSYFNPSFHNYKQLYRMSLSYPVLNDIMLEEIRKIKSSIADLIRDGGSGNNTSKQMRSNMNNNAKPVAIRVKLRSTKKWF